jgi:S-adenosylmethionine-dependent methyltransferase
MAIRKQAGFDEVASVFADYGTSVRGYIRYKVIQDNLTSYLKGKRLTILDIGGGSGPDTAWLAQAGHEVTLLEPSPRQRSYAQRRFNFFLDKEDLARIRVVPCGLQDFDAEPFDMVLAHGVAMYQADPIAFIRLAASMVKQGGILSIAAKGYYGAEARAVHDLDVENLLRLRTNQRSINHIGQDVYSFKPEELKKVLVGAGFYVERWSGVRVITDQMYARVSDVDPEVLSEVLAAEQRQGRQPSIRGQGQMLHFIARHGLLSSKKGLKL